MHVQAKELCSHGVLPENTGRIGIFDSGVGGLCVVREILKASCPVEILYVADQENSPYGNRPMETLRGLSEKICRFLVDRGAQVIVMACNSASAAALYTARETFSGIRFVGMEPALKPAASQTVSGRIAILATEATFAGTPYKNLVSRYGNGKTLIECACPEFVRMVENGSWSHPEAAEVVAGVLAPLLAAGVDRIVLGCTHFSFLKQIIQDTSGPAIEVIDPAGAVALQTLRVAEHLRPALATGSIPEHRFFTTGDTAIFKRQVSAILNRRVRIEKASWV